jgi:dual specificity MAP kinase phosphatase
MGHSFALDMDMDIDTDLDLDHSHRPEAPSCPPSTSPSLGPLDLTCDSSDNAPHMHPVQPRAPRIYTNTAALARDRSASASSSSTSSTQSLSMPSPSTPATSLLDSPPPSCFPLGPPSPGPHSHTAPLIASGFCPRDLLHQNADGNAEFIPLRVPDGISLRNFDIQLVRFLCHVIHSSPLFFFFESMLFDSSLHFFWRLWKPQVR